MDQYIFLGDYDLRGKVYGPIKFPGGFWKVKQDGAATLRTGARQDTPEGSSVSFGVVFDNELDANAFLAYAIGLEKDCEDLYLYIRSHDWRFSVWGVVVKPTQLNESPMDYMQYHYEVFCYLYAPYSYSRAFTVWAANSITLGTSAGDKSLFNAEGHYPTSFESLRVTCHYSAAKVDALTLAINGETLTLCDLALSEEIWELLGNEEKLLETYEDLITSGTVWGHDVTGSGTYDTGKIKLNNAESGYYRLSGPNKVACPIIMTADLSLDAGGATGEAFVEISSDHVSWETAITQAEFLSGAQEYVLQGTEFMTDVYVRFRCNSGTSGKYLRIGSVKFEVERWIESGAVPAVPAGTAKTATLDAGSGSHSVDILGTFVQRRLFA